MTKVSETPPPSVACTSSSLNNIEEEIELDDSSDRNAIMSNYATNAEIEKVASSISPEKESDEENKNRNEDDQDFLNHSLFGNENGERDGENRLNFTIDSTKNRVGRGKGAAASFGYFGHSKRGVHSGSQPIQGSGGRGGRGFIKKNFFFCKIIW